MVATIGMSDVEIMVTPLTNVNIPKIVTSSVAWETQKLRERGSLDQEIVDHLLEIDALTEPATSKNNVKENSVTFMRQGWHTVKNSHKVSWPFNHLVLCDKLNTLYLHL